ncbi:MAG: enoyl-CoA hydratase/isomerase family protein [Alphaproteobacteria bacterium]|nr:enoyl-CoA hydratase/isomerase family protein [Alphaproteobacteria bacterium]
MSFSHISTEIIGKTGIITLNQTRQLNALSLEMLKELKEALSDFTASEEVKAIILAGSDRAFCVGIDIKELESSDTKDDFLYAFSQVEDSLQNCKKPVIAAVSGYVLSAGLSLVLLCDIVLAADNARFGYPEITLSMLPIDFGGYMLAREVGKSKAMEMILSGRNMEVAEAERCGLVSRIVPLADLIPDAMRTAERIADMSSSALQLAKKSVNAAFGLSADEGIRRGRQHFIESLSGADCKESIKAYLAKE